MWSAKDVIQLLLAAIAFVLAIAVAAWLFFQAGDRAATPRGGAAADMPQAEFERRVRDYLLDKPEIIAEAMQKLEARQQAAVQNEVKEVLKTKSEEIFRDPASPAGGNPEGDVNLVEFFDYNCRYCRQVSPHLVKVEASDLKLRIVYKEFPILGPNSDFAAKAALAAHRQGKYVAFHQELMQSKEAVDEARVFAAAATVGLDAERLRADMDDPAIQAAIDRNLALARALRIDGTPGFLIGEQIVRGAVDLDTMERLIREAREKK
jgi:protein-disulfide isomerase